MYTVAGGDVTVAEVPAQILTFPPLPVHGPGAEAGTAGSASCGRSSRNVAAMAGAATAT